MTKPWGPRRPDPRWVRSTGSVLAALILPLALLLPGVITCTATAQGIAPDSSTDALPDSVCRRLVDAFESLEPSALRPVLAATDLQIAVVKGRGSGRPEARPMSAEQAIVYLREALLVGQRRPLDALGPEAVLASLRTVGCNCPSIGPSGVDAFLVLHFGGDERSGRVRRLYLDLRRDATGWRVRAVRELT